MMVIGRFQ